MAAPNDRPIEIQMGGLNSASPASQVYPDALDATNMRWGKAGQLMKMSGYATYNSTVMPGTLMPITGLFELNRRDTTTRYTVACSRDRVFSVPTSGAWTALISSLTAGNNDYWDGAMFNNELILTNGVDAPQKTDGTAAGSGALVSQGATQSLTTMVLKQSLNAGLHTVEPGVLIAASGATEAGSYDGGTLKYDTVGDAWVTMTRGNVNRDVAAGFVAYGKVHVVSGLTTGAALTTSVEQYNHVDDVWIARTAVTAARRQQTGHGANNSGYIQTGNDNAGAAAWTTANYSYDPATDAWTTRTAITSTARRQALGFTISNVTHVVSGRTTAGPDNNVTTHDEYNPFTDGWTSLTAITAARRDGTACGSGGDDNLGYTAGGFDTADAASNVIRSYNRVTDAWTAPSATLGTARVILGSAADNWWVYFTGGAVGANASGVHERYSTSPAAPIALYIEAHRGYLLMARTSSKPSRVFYSLPGDSRIWDPDAFFDVNPDDGEWITGLFVFDGRLYVSKTNRIYQISFSVLDPVEGDHQIIELENVPGTVSNRSIVVTDRGVYYLAKDGFRLFDGARSINISEKIQPTLDGYVDSRQKYSQGVWWRIRDEIWWSVTATGSTHDTFAVFNYKWGRWSLALEIEAESAAVVSDANDIDQFLFGHASNGTVYTEDSGNSLGGGALRGSYQTGWIMSGPGETVEDLTPRALWIWATRSGNWNLTVRTRVNFTTSNETTDNLNLSTKNRYFQATTDVRARVPLGADSKGHALSIIVRNDNADEPFEIHRMALELHRSPSGSGYPVVTV